MALIGRIKDNKLYIKGEIIEGQNIIRIKDNGNIELDEIIEGEPIRIDGKTIKIVEIIEGGV